MGDWFVSALNLSLEAGMIVIAVLVLRLIFRNVPKWLHCLMWAIVAVKLICPFSIESDFSYFVSRHTAQMQVSEFEDAVETLLPSGPSMRVVMKEEEGIASAAESEQTAAEPNNLPQKAEYVDHIEFIERESLPERLARIGGYLWLGGASLIAAYAIGSCIAMKRRLSDAVLMEGHVYRSDRISSAFLFGLIRPKIYIPFDIEDENLKQVIAHEEAHLHRRDNITKALAFAIAAVYWFNPIVWLAYVLYCRDMELACDERVIRGKGEEQRKAYSNALVECSSRNSAFRIHNTVPVKFGELAVKKRIRNVLNKKKTAAWVIVIVLAAIALIGMLYLTRQPEGYLAEDVLYKYESEIPEEARALNRAVSDVLLNDEGVSVSDITVGAKTYRCAPYRNDSEITPVVCCGEGHVILGYEETDTSAEVYLMGGSASYGFINGDLVGCCAAIPTLMRFDKDSEEKFIFREVQLPEDGEGYADSLYEIFPKEMADRIMYIEDTPYEYNAIVEVVNRQCAEYAEGYLKALGRIAKVLQDTEFHDYNLSIDYGVSFDLANDLTIMYSDYHIAGGWPAWCGEREVWEYGKHCVYSSVWDGNHRGSGVVTFMKYEYDTGRVYEKDSYRIEGDKMTCIEGNDRTGVLNNRNTEPEIHIPGVSSGE